VNIRFWPEAEFIEATGKQTPTVVKLTNLPNSNVPSSKEGIEYFK
jgi:hypothetical protein